MSYFSGHNIRRDVKPKGDNVGHARRREKRIPMDSFPQARWMGAVKDDTGIVARNA